jgi:predicted Zn finger-like uncharacterized protein
MRLICPSCQAHYEVDDMLLPPEGREVQCSACDFIWFQAHPKPAPEVAAQAPLPEAAFPEAPFPEVQAPDAPPAPGAAPRTVSGPALDVLREEAAFEARLRAAEAKEPQDSQHSGTIAPTWPSAAPQVPPENPPDSTTRQPPANFPDIEDFRPPLGALGADAAGDGDSGQPIAPGATWRSFLRGFAMPVLLAGIAAAPYLLAAEIGAALPAAEGALASYVAAVDALRVKLAGLVGG